MRARDGWAPGLVALAAVALAALVALSSLTTRRRAEAPLALTFVPVPLERSDPSRARVGALLYLGGIWLRSADARFGGLSDLRVSADGARLVAVSDCGHGFTASLSYDARGGLAGLADARLVELRGLDGGPLALSETDAESLVAEGGELEVGFEERAKVLAYRADPPFAGPVRRLPIPAGLAGCGPGTGLEAMAAMGDGRQLLVCEGRRRASGTVPAWVGGGEAWTEREYPLVFEGGWAEEPFRPTGAALLPDGDLLVLERRFPPLGARLVRLPRASLDGTGQLVPREVARLEAPLTIDNFEGLDVRRDTSGRTLVYLLSDDNGCDKPGSLGTGLQRTLLLMFSLEG